MSAPTALAPLTGVSALLDAVGADAPHLDVRAPSAATASFAWDAGTAPRQGEPAGDGPAVAVPRTVAEVQELVRLAARYGVSVVPRGAGTGLSGGAGAQADQLVISTDRLDRIVEVSPADEVAVVEPGVLNAALNDRLAPLGLFYAPDPASWRISTIGGNIATNAGGLRCAKYGVTRESVLALDIVLADGSLVSVGHRSIKGVTGLDLVSLFVGSEGVLGIVVGATVRIRPLPVARRTVTAFFASTAEGVTAIGAITASRVRPSVVEFLDEPTLVGIDAAQNSDLRARGAALLLIELDGFGIDEQTAELTAALEAAGARVRVESETDAEVFWELRRSGRRFDERSWFAGGDVAVPKSRIAEMFAGFSAIESRHGVEISAVAHAGDGNLHPVVTLPIPAGADPANPPAALHHAVDDIVRAALALGGTVSGEHGIGTVKRALAAEELADRVRAAQFAIKSALDPVGLFNPGKAL
ncbi:FAD-linked oxidase C-terminal domain-containing protein [Microbacterium sp. KSW2-29]|uniref:FAD-linked oxidase C-terminal domain-containing protein n=1 Tax=Microbacterium phycohabitans TaxID=3075993 RepID=A0ABU3SLJ4_9MICO|nr:FAD-linked oxidase C-terminal domain-containing protein [Microbacterium sp. KSW2-29]MDU0345674.1 FAD-linked oxidase C-terminal domain-containing protein [Microbacterium sp. KSW2-29]